MMFRFSLYGFLKNQQYFEPFLLLAFLDMGLSFTLIGLLIGFRELLRNLAEIPSGAVADLLGRRRSLVFSFCCYILSFGTIGTVGLSLVGEAPVTVVFSALVLAMGLYALGDAFRSGTHKALIFTYLRISGRTDERTRVYGFTRSWSKLGSSLSVLLACAFVYYSDDYIWIFYISIIPFILNVFNVATYPDALDGLDDANPAGAGAIVEHLKQSFALVLGSVNLRRLIAESVAFEGFLKSSKDYLQPILKLASIPLVAAMFGQVEMSEVQQSIILIGPVYFLLYLGAAVASRKAYRLVDWTGDEEAAARLMWVLILALCVVLAPALYYNVFWFAILAFVSLHLLQNIWRPIFVARIDSYGEERKGATLLSIQSQAQSLGIMILAPVLGYAIDVVKAEGIGGEFWPIALCGVLLASVFAVLSGKRAGHH